MPNSTKVIRDLQFYFAKLDEPVSPFGTPIYDLQLRFPKERITEMTPFGKVRPVEDGQYAINVTRKEKNSKGQKTPVRIVDSTKQPIKDLIGNGSTGNVIVYQYDYNVNGRTGTKTILVAVQVTNLIKYEPEGIDFDVIGDSQEAMEAKADF